ncbi:MAG: (2Fe-2S)-binding protein [Methylococcaceae bacterium]|jgi:bacterioferritin-associated ferredoxin
MYICICKGVTDSQIRKTVTEKGVSSIRGLRQELGACDQCGKCALAARQVINECLQNPGATQSRVLSAA